MRSVFVILALCIVALSGCSSSDSNTNPSTPTYYLTAKIDGTAFESTSGVAVGVFTRGSLTVSGSAMVNGTQRQISLVFGGAAAGKTYNMADDGESGATLMMSATIGDSYFAGNGVGTGSITITSMSGGEAAGTFSFVCSNGTSTKSVTDGKFRVKYTTI
ncbi:MAG: hypothetical protein JSS89_09260 [Bacteroidetes bacterium]|nr:hypothetical protein [Bacteroidota bacterium]